MTKIGVTNLLKPTADAAPRKKYGPLTLVLPHSPFKKYKPFETKAIIIWSFITLASSLNLVITVRMRTYGWDSQVQVSLADFARICTYQNTT